MILTMQDLPMAAHYVKRVVLLKSGVVLGACSVDSTLTEPVVYSVFGVHAERAYTTGGETNLLFHRVQRDRMNRAGETSSRTPLIRDSVR